MRKATVKYFDSDQADEIEIVTTGWVHAIYHGNIVIEEESTSVLKSIHKPIEITFLDNPDMQPLTKEQKEYIELKTAMDGMLSKFRSLQDAGEISHCVPYSVGETTKFVVEALFNEYLERLKHEKKTEHKPIG
jgi:hypothetical protein